VPTWTSAGVLTISFLRSEVDETTMEDRWLSVDEIAGYLGIKRDTVYKWVDAKRLPGHKVGRLWKFKRDEVDGWVRSQPQGDNDTALSASSRKRAEDKSR
jgi:excisionase family DNA binding protein